MMFRRDVDAATSQLLLEALDMRRRSVDVLAAFDTSRKTAIAWLDYLAWQCVGDDFVIAQIGSYGSNVLKAFAR
jgi:hypothetical protein